MVSHNFQRYQNQAHIRADELTKGKPTTIWLERGLTTI